VLGRRPALRPCAVRRTSLVTQGRLALRVLQQRVGRPAPLFATLFVTERCNVRCDGCVFYDALHAERPGRKVLPAVHERTERALRIVDAVVEGGVPVLSYAGGEPFLREDLPAILAHGRARGLSQLVVTNGLVRSPAILRAVEATCDALVFSPHPPEELGGGGAEARWALSWELLGEMRRALSRSELTVGITLGRHTLPRLEEILRRARDAGVDRVRCHPNFYPAQFPSESEVLAAQSLLREWCARYPALMDDPTLFIDDLPGYFAPTPRVPCMATRSINLGIFLDGTVSACCAERVVIGNLLERPLRELRATPAQRRDDCYGCHRTDVRLAQRYAG
jgi:MoaA/NifB/PqqE/SkfB family radical SAM enzyme